MGFCGSRRQDNVELMFLHLEFHSVLEWTGPVASCKEGHESKTAVNFLNCYVPAADLSCSGTCNLGNNTSAFLTTAPTCCMPTGCGKLRPQGETEQSLTHWNEDYRDDDGVRFCRAVQCCGAPNSFCLSFFEISGHHSVVFSARSLWMNARTNFRWLRCQELNLWLHGHS